MNEHRWMIIVPYRLSGEEAARVMEEGVTAILDLKHVDMDAFAPTVGCYHCEMMWSQASGKPCPGEPKGHLPNGDPYWHEKPEGW